MPILNYTTKVAPEKTASDITALLARKGARTVSMRYSPKGQVDGISFSLMVGKIEVTFALPANVEGVAEYMRAETRSLTRERTASIAAQAPRTAWRVLKDWVEVQIALVDSRQAEMGQVFMPYAITPGGETMYQRFLTSTQKMLGTGE